MYSRPLHRGDIDFDTVAMNDRLSIDTHTQWKIFYVYYDSTGGSGRVNCVHISDIFLKVM